VANFPTLSYPDWIKGLLSPRAGATASGSGLIGAHQIGAADWTRNGFDEKFESLKQFGIGVDKSSNGETLAQSKKGAATTGASNHDGFHPRALSDAQYDSSEQPRSSGDTAVPYGAVPGTRAVPGTQY
jgi:hypothetical protein